MDIASQAPRFGKVLRSTRWAIPGGYVNEPNRCNVALSRAQERLIIVGARKMWGDEKCASPMRTILHKITGVNGGSALGVVKAAGSLLQ